MLGDKPISSSNENQHDIGKLFVLCNLLPCCCCVRNNSREMLFYNTLYDENFLSFNKGGQYGIDDEYYQYQRHLTFLEMACHPGSGVMTMNGEFYFNNIIWSVKIDRIEIDSSFFILLSMADFNMSLSF